MSSMEGSASARSPSWSTGQASVNREWSICMPTIDLSGAIWRTSSYTGNGNNGDCVEVAFAPEVTALRDSKDRAGGALVVGRTSWSAFLEAARQ